MKGWVWHMKMNKIMKKDETILTHLKPCGYQYYTDTYFCNIYYKNKDVFMYTVMDKVQKWVEDNGGKFKRLSDKNQFGQQKGFIVRIVFPTFNKRDMKNIMALLWGVK